MFKVTKKQFMSFVIAVVMLSSTIGFLLSSSFGNNSPHSGNTNIPDIPVQAPEQVTTLPYTADNIKVTVQELFTTVILIGVSNADSVSNVATDLQAIDGIISVTNSQFLVPQTGRTENFRTELRLTEAGKIQDVLASLQEADFLEEVTIIPQALIELPETVAFTNSSLEDTFDYTFSDPKAQAFVLSDTQIGDEILVSLEGSFQGKTLIDLTAFEQANLTSSPSLYFFDDEFEIASFNNEFFVRTTGVYSEIEKLEGVRDSITDSYENNIIVQSISQELLINFKDTDSFFEQDLEIFFETFEGAQAYNLQLDQGFATVAFGDVDFAVFIVAIETELNVLGFEVDSIEEPLVSLQGNVSSESKEDFIVLIESLGTENGFEMEILQQAVIEAESLYIPDIESDLSVPEGSFNTFVATSRNVGETVNLSMFVSASKRSGIESVESQEAVAVTQ